MIISGFQKRKSSLKRSCHKFKNKKKKLIKKKKIEEIIKRSKLIALIKKSKKEDKHSII